GLAARAGFFLALLDHFEVHRADHAAILGQCVNLRGSHRKDRVLGASPPPLIVVVDLDGVIFVADAHPHAVARGLFQPCSETHGATAYLIATAAATRLRVPRNIEATSNDGLP